MKNLFHVSPGTQKVLTRIHLFARQLHFLGYVQFIGFLFAVLSLLGFMGGYWWTFDLFSHFRPQYCLLFLVACLLFFYYRRIAVALLFLLLLAINLLPIIPQFIPVAAKAFPSSHLRLMSANVRTSNNDHHTIQQVITRFHPDVLVLEEVNTRWLQDLQPALRGYPYSFTCPAEDNFGIAVFSKVPLRDSNIGHYEKVAIPTISTTILLPERPLLLLCTHIFPPFNAYGAHTAEIQLAAIHQTLQTLPGPYIVMGDFNTSPYSYNFQRLLQDNYLHNGAEGFGLQVSWPAHCLPLAMQIDHCLLSSELQTSSFRTGPAIGSDHYPIIVDIVVQSK